MYICLYKCHHGSRFAQNPPIYAGYQRLAVLDRLDKMRRHGGRDGLRQCGCGQETLTSQIASNAPDHYRETESELTLSQVNGHAAATADFKQAMANLGNVGTLVIVPALIAQPDASQFHRAMISLDLAARHRMVRPAADMSDAFVLESLRSKQSPQPLPHRE
jgi:hypothetical protein